MSPRCYLGRYGAPRAAASSPGRPRTPGTPALGHHSGVPRSSELAELSSLTSTLEELTRRVSAIAETARDDGDEDLALELFGAERSLQGSLRRLRRVSDSAG